MNKLQAKTALITGGNSGIGLATAQLFVAEGARVAITGRDAATLDEVQRASGGQILAIRSDAGRVEDINALMAEAKGHLGHLDVLFVNAAFAQPLPFDQIGEDQFDALTAANFKGVFFTIQKALPLLRKGSSVIVTTSISNQMGAPHFSVYAACKAALKSLVQSLALELAERGIRVNAISPGPIDTPGFGRWGLPQEAVDAIRADFERRSPVKRFGRADEVAKMALFLATEESSYCVGAEMVVDGGFSLLL